MEVCYVVTFKPQEVRAYSAELIVVTEREKFVVPVGALGHRAVLDFPDQVLYIQRQQKCVEISRGCGTYMIAKPTNGNVCVWPSPWVVAGVDQPGTKKQTGFCTKQVRIIRRSIFLPPLWYDLHWPPSTLF